MSDYPEHDRMRAVQSDSQIVGGFLEWLLEDTPYFIAEYDDRNRMQPINIGFERLLAQYLNIDLDKIETEKQQMLDEIRKANSDLGPGITGG